MYLCVAGYIRLGRLQQGLGIDLDDADIVGSRDGAGCINKLVYLESCCSR